MARQSKKHERSALSVFFFVLGLVIASGGVAYILYVSHQTMQATLHGAYYDNGAFMRRSMTLWLSTSGAAVACFVVAFVADARHRSRIDKKRRDAVIRIATTNAELNADEFLDAACSKSAPDYTGVYILHNTTKDAYYVGQSVHVLQRVTQHLTGHGNGDVYADYKHGNTFTVRLVPLVGSGYENLNDLERDMIEAYDAYECGYNATRGNRT
jgi:hypothetical protein